MSEIRADILIVGASAGGVAAALAACDLFEGTGRTVVMTEPTDWIGGQLTSQGVPPDENRWVEEPGPVGANMSYKMYRTLVREWYRRNRDLTESAAGDPLLNPGRGWVSRLCAEPRVMHVCLNAMLSPHVMSGALRIVTRAEPVGADVEGERVRSVSFDTPGGEMVVSAEVVLDASEDGALWPVIGAEHAIGAEGKSVYGELHAPDRTDEADQQACSWCFAMEHRPGEDHTIDRPGAYKQWRDWIPEMAEGSAPWTGPLFSWLVPSHNEEGMRELPLVPWPDDPEHGQLELWRYRRIVCHGIHEGASPPPDVCLVNWVQMDYWRKPLLGVAPDERAAALAEAKEQSRCLLYWMQCDAPRHDGGNGYPGLRLRGDELGTEDGFAKAAYIREPRRLLSLEVMHEGHVGTDQRLAEGKPEMDTSAWGHAYGEAELFSDAVAVGHYPIDLHPSCSGRNSVYVPCAPYRVPLGSLIPRRLRNVVAASKCLGVSHVVNATTRMHHSEWNIGEAGGALAAWCLRESVEPHAVHGDTARVRAFQELLADRGCALRWPWEED